MLPFCLETPFFSPDQLYDYFDLSLVFVSRGLKDMEQDISSIEKRFAYGFLQKLLKWMDIAQEFIAHLGTWLELNDFIM